MKRLLFFALLLLCPATAHAHEQAVVGKQSLDCEHVTYLQHVDVTVGEQCTRSLLEFEAARTFFDIDPIAAPMLNTWALQYAFAAPTYEPIHQKTLAIIDTGFTTESSWLQSFVTHTYNVVTEESVAIDTINHGTAVAATAILAMRNAPANVIVIKVDNSGSLSIANIVKGINYAIEQNADIINLSLGGTYTDPSEKHAIEQALAKGITIVAAAGNEGHFENKPNYPASYDGVLSIGAINEQQERAFFSTYNNRVSFAAPGINLPLLRGDHIDNISGTSFASPFVAGLIAAIEQYSDSSPNILKQALQTTATDIATPGYDDETGYGIIAANDALQWLRGDEQPMRTITNPFITITFSSDVAPHTTISLYRNGQIVPATTTITKNEAIITPMQIVYDELYRLKIDRAIQSVQNVAIDEPMYVPIQFQQERSNIQ